MSKTENKKILFITPFFAPQTHAAVFRAHKFVKGLALNGWEVHVVTVDTNYNYNENQDLLAELPENVVIHPTRYIEPTIRGIRMALGGKNRTFAAMAANGAYDRRDIAEDSEDGMNNSLDVQNPNPEKHFESNPSGKQTNPSEHKIKSIQLDNPKQSLGQKIYSQLLDQFLFFPDAYWTWKKSATNKAVEIIKAHGISTFYTTSLPYSTLEIGLKVKEKTGAKWIADFRDPLSYSYRFHSSRPSDQLRQQSIEKESVFKADRVLTLSSAQPLILKDQYPELDMGKVHFIPTGLDKNLLDGVERKPSRPGQLIFVGEYLKDYGFEFFEHFAVALKDPRVSALNPLLKIIGRREVNQPIVEPALKRLGIEDRVVFVDHLSQSELYREVLSSSSAVLCTARSYPWWTNFAKMVDYIGLKVPVLAIVPDPSEARKWLGLSGLGQFIDGPVGSETEKVLAALTPSSSSSSVQIDETVCQMFTMEHQVQAFEKLIT